MKLIDTHAHLYMDQFEDMVDIIERCRNEGVERVYLPNVDVKSIQGLDALAASDPAMFYPMMGLHPCSVTKDYLSDLSIIKESLDSKNYIGVGEIGIDMYWDQTHVKEQVDAYHIQIRWAKEKKIPIIIHSRDSLDMTIAGIDEYQDGSLKGIFHCFNGTIEQAKKIMDLGFYLGIGGVVTFKNAGVDKVVAQLPLESLVLETDAPYLSPVPYRGKRNESAYIRLIADKIAELKSISTEEVAKKTYSNSIKIFHS